MIKIQKADEVEEEFFCTRNFGESIESVRDILRNVKLRKDEALREYSKKFDLASPHNLKIPEETLKAAAEKMQSENPKLYDSLCYSRDLAVRFAKRQRESFDDFEIELEPGVFTGQKNIPVEKAGLYVPAGRFPLVSTVVMTSSPAIAAGVNEIILCTPPRKNPDGSGEPYADENIMAASYICGIKEVFACGGSQAIAAMAFGTESIPAVDVIVGPGNKYVAEAKRLVYGTVGIDMIAGPTEVFIIADKTANPVWVAADLLAQAEHDIVAQPVMATDSMELAEKVSKEIEKQLESLPTKATAEQSINTFGRIIVTKNLEQAAELANKKAPEHLELALDASLEREKIQSLVHNYGSLFIGHGAAEVFGDYAAGLNHTLPTSGSARFTGGLSVRSFIKTVTTLRTDNTKSGAKKSAESAGFLGDAEGLAAHAKAARLRLE
ncbi:MULTISPECIES: histidinol dehydrogenase [unclassified Treponema]|uniref:histidinol dehydrogenase n=1 Tax=unclassified Treponema TaxID=2638727 RepID=UPI000E7F36DE|nr:MULTISPECIES: histidinol dehydrogenase [unclassified Treponema]HAZ96649.1 histidinol dehydrogenase [Treponema sp.]